MASTADPTKQTHEVSAADERTPLLNAPDTAGSKAISQSVSQIGNENGDLGHSPSDQDGSQQTPGPHEEDEDKPMPYLQVVILCYASLVEPVAYFAIFPIIGEMLEHTGGVAIADIGFWAGLIEALFSIVQMLLMIFYGKLADRIGRKPVLVWSLGGIAAASAVFGLSQKLWHMILLRCMAGVFAGSSVTIRAMLSEVTTKRTQARAFSWYMFAKNLGIFIGPLIGGGLADPAENLPGFKGVAFFEKYPYALSTFVTAAFCASTAIASSVALKETLKTAVKGGPKPAPPMTTLELLKSPGVGMVIYVYGHIMLLALAFTALNPIFSYTPIHLGGLGFPPQWISIFVAVMGASQALWMLGPYPPLQQRFGTGPVLSGCLIVWPVLVALMPILNLLLRHDQTTAFWILLCVTAVFGSGVSMSFASIQLCLNDIAPSSSTLGTLNAIALTVNSAVRSFAPVAASSIYAWGVNTQWLNGQLAWIILAVLAAAVNLALPYLPEKALAKPTKKPRDSES